MQLDENSKVTRVFLSLPAQAALNDLERRAITDKRAQSLVRAIQYKTNLLKTNSRYGKPVPKNLIPGHYQTEYNADNLYRLELPQFWRATYTIQRNNTTPPERAIHILDILPHPKYDKLFGYKRK